MQKESSLMYQFLRAQKESPRKGDWYSGVQKNLKEFEIYLSDESVKKMPEADFKRIVKSSSVNAAVKYLKGKQNGGDKGAGIIYNELELQDYLNPYSNFTLEQQRKIFSLRTKMNPLKTNFSRNKQMNPEFCIQVCKMEINNEHLTWCGHLNSESDLRYEQLLNGTLQEKRMALNQIESNEKRRREELKN